MSANRLICYFPVILQHLDFEHFHQLIISFWILPVRKLISPADFQTGTGAAAQATLGTAIYFLYDSCSCWYNCLSAGFWWRSDCNVTSSMYFSLIGMTFWTVHAVLKCFGDTGHILAYFLIMLQGRVMKFGLHSFPFFTNIKDTGLPSEACLYCCIK